MKTRILVLTAVSLFAASVPSFAMEHGQQHDKNCQKQCEMLVKNCGQDVDTIQERISRLRDAIQKNAGRYTQEELMVLKAKLRDAEATLSSLENAGA